MDPHFIRGISVNQGYFGNKLFANYLFLVKSLVISQSLKREVNPEGDMPRAFTFKPSINRTI